MPDYTQNRHLYHSSEDLDERVDDKYYVESSDDNDPRAELFHAIDQRDNVAVEELLRKGARLDNVALRITGYGKPYTALRRAVLHSSTEIVSVLLDHGADPNFAPALDRQQTTLHIAVKENLPDIIKLLLLHNADPMVLDHRGKTPLQGAIEHNRHQIAEILLAHNGFQTGFAHEKHGRTALHRACKPGWFDVVQELLKRGATIDARDENDRLPIHYASRSGPVETVAALLAAGSSSNAKDATGKTPLHMAAAGDDGIHRGSADEESTLDKYCGPQVIDLGVINKLIEAGGRRLVNEKDVDGRTPLHLAGARNNTEVAKKLIALGADVNASAANGSKPIHDAVLSRAFRTVDLFLENGANPRIIARGPNQCQILEPEWDRFLHQPLIGYHTIRRDLAVSSTLVSNLNIKEVCEGLRCSVLTVKIDPCGRHRYTRAFLPWEGQDPAMRRALRRGGHGKAES